jgi:hypothetical protein
MVRVCDSLKPVALPHVLVALPSSFDGGTLEPKAARKKDEMLVKRSAWT